MLQTDILEVISYYLKSTSVQLATLSAHLLALLAANSRSGHQLTSHSVAEVAQSMDDLKSISVLVERAGTGDPEMQKYAVDALIAIADTDRLLFFSGTETLKLGLLSSSSEQEQSE
jgi:hypothetical protein